MSNEDRAPSPPDGPAKVRRYVCTKCLAPLSSRETCFECEPTDLCGEDPGPIADGLHWEKRPDGTEVLRSNPKCDRCNDTGWAPTYLRHNESTDPCHCVEGMKHELRAILHHVSPADVVERMGDEQRALTLSALLSLIPPEQVDGATVRLMVERGYHKLLWPTLAQERDEALARAESLRDRLATIIDEALGLHEVMAVDDLLTTLERELHESHRNHAAALARAEKAEIEIAELKENRNAWHQRALQAEASYRQAIAQAERERDAMHAAAEELRAQDAVLPEAHSGSPSGEWQPPSPTPDKFECLAECPPPFIDSDNHPWVWNHVWWRTGPRCSDCGELTSDDHCECDTDTMRFGPCWVDQEGTEIEARLIRRLAPLPAIRNGTGRKTEENDGKSELQRVAHSEPGDGHAPGRGAESGRDGGDPGDSRGGDSVPTEPERGEGTSGGDSSEQHQLARPPGIPASATIWAEVVDGLGRKVGAWFSLTTHYGNPIPCVIMPHQMDNQIVHYHWTPEVARCWDSAPNHPANAHAAAQCRQLYERGMKEQAEIKAWAENMAGFVCDESIDTGAKAAAALTRPACIPSHIPDTDWTVIEGRAVWRFGEFLYVASPVGPSWEVAREAGWHDCPDKLRFNVTQTLFLAARRWMGWEKLALSLPDASAFQHPAKPALTAVDLTELREAWNDRGCKGYWARVEGAVEKLLSGGAP